MKIEISYEILFPLILVLLAREVLDVPNSMKIVLPETVARKTKSHYNSYVKSLREAVQTA